jgi:hypothetical protein
MGLITDMFEFMAESKFNTVGNFICFLFVYRHCKTHFLPELLITQDLTQLEHTHGKCFLNQQQTFLYLIVE